MIKIMKYGQVPNTEIFARVTPAVNVEQIVADIIANVRANGDRAVLDYNLKFDKAQLDTLLVSQEEIDEAFAAVEPRFLSILEQAAENIRDFHSKQVRNSFVIADKPGIVLGQKVTPIEKSESPTWVTCSWQKPIPSSLPRMRWWRPIVSALAAAISAILPRIMNTTGNC